jgi:hypothetical protein
MRAWYSDVVFRADSGRAVSVDYQIISCALAGTWARRFGSGKFPAVAAAYFGVFIITY